MFKKLNVLVVADCINRAQDRDEWRVVVNTVSNLRVPGNAYSFIPNRGSSSFLRRIVLFGVEALWAVNRPQSQARLFSRASRPTMGPEKPPVQTAQRKSCREMKLTTHFHLEPRFRMHGATPPHSKIYRLLVCDDALSSRRRLPVFPSGLLPPRRQVLTKHWY
jgi:hypothetical protein